MPDNNEPWVQIGDGEMTMNGQPVGRGKVFIAPVGTPLPPALPAPQHVNGTYRPCATCHHPAAVIINGVQQIPPGGVTLQWDPADPSSTAIPRRRFFIPHAEDCAEAIARDTDPDQGRVYLPARTLSSVKADIPPALAAAGRELAMLLRQQNEGAQE